MSHVATYELPINVRKTQGSLAMSDLADLIRKKQEIIEKETQELNELHLKVSEQCKVKDMMARKECMYDVKRVFGNDYPVHLIKGYMLEAPRDYYNTSRVVVLLLKIQEKDCLLLIDEYFDTFTTFKFQIGSMYNRSNPTIAYGSGSDLILTITTNASNQSTTSEKIAEANRLLEYYGQTNEIFEYAINVMDYIKGQHYLYTSVPSKCTDRINARLILGRWKQSALLKSLSRDIIKVIVTELLRK